MSENVRSSDFVPFPPSHMESCLSLAVTRCSCKAPPDRADRADIALRSLIFIVAT